MFLLKIKMSKERNLLCHEKMTNRRHSVNVLAALIYYKLFHYFTLSKMSLKQVNKNEKLKVVTSYIGLIGCLLFHSKFGKAELN